MLHCYRSQLAVSQVSLYIGRPKGILATLSKLSGFRGLSVSSAKTLRYVSLASAWYWCLPLSKQHMPCMELMTPLISYVLLVATSQGGVATTETEYTSFLQRGVYRRHRSRDTKANCVLKTVMRHQLQVLPFSTRSEIFLYRWREEGPHVLRVVLWRETCSIHCSTFLDTSAVSTFKVAISNQLYCSVIPS